MRRQRSHGALFPAIAALAIGLGVGTAAAENIDPENDGSRFAWGENVGWVNLRPAFGPGVTVTDSALAGFAWAENLGWINLGPIPGAGVVNDGLGGLSGFAWSENAGWINFAPLGGGVSINACGEFEGDAWGENVGWIRFRSSGAFPFAVTTAWVSPVDTTAPVTSVAGPGPGWNTAPVSVTLSATDCGSGVLELHHTLDANPEVVTPGSSAAFDVTADGIHSLSYFAMDHASNSEDIRFLAIPIDQTPPAISVATPADGASFFLNQTVAVDFSVTDATSGLAGVTSTLADGSPLDTSTLGPRTFGALATDQAGNAASVNHGYAIVVCPPEPAPAGIVNAFAGGGAEYEDGEPATDAYLTGILGLGVDSAENVFLSDNGAYAIRRVDGATGIISTLAGNGSFGFDGDGGPATEASLSTPWDLTVDLDGNVYFADQLNSRIRKVDVTTGIITTVAGNGNFIFDGDGGPAVQASLGFPQGVAVDAAGNVYIADTQNYKVREVTAATGIIDTIAGLLHQESCGCCEPGNQLPCCSAGDGGPALEATFSTVMTVALDGAGNVYVLDVCLDALVRRIDAASGIITTVAGGGDGTGESGPAVEANLGFAADIALDAAGNLFIADGSRVWRVDEDGQIRAFAGTGAFGYSGDGGPAIDATFTALGSLAVAGDGDVYIGDHVNHGVVRRVTVDADGDGQANCLDSDDDGDGIPDAAEAAAGSDPQDPASTPEICDGLDNDLDGQTDEGFAYPDNVGPSLVLDHPAAGGELHFTWADTTSADDYVVYEDGLPNGPFTTPTGTAASGTTGLAVPLPEGELVYYLVTGRNACGEGPLH